MILVCISNFPIIAQLVEHQTVMVVRYLGVAGSIPAGRSQISWISWSVGCTD